MEGEDDQYRNQFSQTIEEFGQQANSAYQGQIKQQISILNNQEYLLNHQSQQKYYLSQENMIRFLKARNQEIDKALELWKNWVIWHLQNQPQKITFKQMIPALQQEVSFLYTYDLKGHAFVYTLLKNYDRIKTLKEIQQLTLYMFEEALKKSKINNKTQITIIFDIVDFKFSQICSYFFECSKCLIDILQNYYPENLYKVYIIRSNIIVKQLFNVVKKFMSEKTANKFFILQEYEELLEHFNIQDLPNRCRGTCPIKLLYEECYQSFINKNDEDDKNNSEIENQVLYQDQEDISQIDQTEFQSFDQNTQEFYQELNNSKQIFQIETNEKNIHQISNGGGCCSSKNCYIF